MNLALVTPAEAPALAALHAAAFPPGEGWDAAAFATLLGMPGAFALLAPDAGFLLGRVAADEAEVVTLAVTPAARRQGTGRALVDTACILAAGEGAAAMFLEVEEDNAPALALYESCGFARVGRRAGYYGPGRHAVVLRRQL